MNPTNDTARAFPMPAFESTLTPQQADPFEFYPAPSNRVIEAAWFVVCAALVAGSFAFAPQIYHFITGG